MIRKFISLLFVLLLSVISTSAVFAASYPSPPSQVEDAAVSGGANVSPMGAERTDSNDTAKTNADGDTTQLTANKFGNLKVQVEPTAKATYIASTAIFTPASSATDIWQIYGSASKTVKIHQIFAYIKGSGTINISEFYLLRRSTANSSGTAVTTTIGKLDSSSPSASAVVKHYTANPTTGTLDHQVQIFGSIGNANSTADARATGATSPIYLTIYDAKLFPAPITLRGTSEGLVINLNGSTIANSGTLSITVVYTEE